MALEEKPANKRAYTRNGIFKILFYALRHQAHMLLNRFKGVIFLATVGTGTNGKAAAKAITPFARNNRLNPAPTIKI